MRGHINLGQQYRDAYIWMKECRPLRNSDDTQKLRM